MSTIHHDSKNESKLVTQPRILKVGVQEEGVAQPEYPRTKITSLEQPGNTKSGESREEVSTSPGIPNSLETTHPFSTITVYASTLILHSTAAGNTKSGKCSERVSTSPGISDHFNYAKKGALQPTRILKVGRQNKGCRPAQVFPSTSPSRDLG